MSGRQSRIVFIRLRCLCLSYTLLQLQYIRLRNLMSVICVYCSSSGSFYSVLAFIYAAPVWEHRHSAGPDPRILLYLRYNSSMN
jgi:hypothetical protein